jgi:hypothetical protein
MATDFGFAQRCLINGRWNVGRKRPRPTYGFLTG